jgi:dihydrodipicolinate synthase/N-acetylneuraminate lyase
MSLSRISGTLAAAATPLRDGGGAPDEGGFEPLVQFLIDGGLNGLLALGTTGEGILLSVPERKRATELFVRAAGGKLDIAAHCGAQTTADTVELAEHAAETGVSAVAVIAPPYFPLDDAAQLAHLSAAARACAPTPFYVYEFERSSGYAVPPHVIDELRGVAPNLAGMKVSDTPWERFQPYLIEGLDVFVGPESLIHQGLAGGAVGAVSALATAFPELVLEAVRSRSAEATARVGELRAAIEGFPRHAALKHVLRTRGVAINPDVRAPLRGLTDAERGRLDELLPAWLEEPAVR